MLLIFCLEICLFKSKKVALPTLRNAGYISELEQSLIKVLCSGQGSTRIFVPYVEYGIKNYVSHSFFMSKLEERTS